MMELRIKEETNINLNGTVEIDGSTVAVLSATIKDGRLQFTEIIQNNLKYQENIEEINKKIDEFKKIANNVAKITSGQDFSMMLTDVLGLGVE